MDGAQRRRAALRPARTGLFTAGRRENKKAADARSAAFCSLRFCSLCFLRPVPVQAGSATVTAALAALITARTDAVPTSVSMPTPNTRRPSGRRHSI